MPHHAPAAVGGGSTAQGIGRDVLGIVNTNYNDYQDRLAGFVNPQLQATTALARASAGANKTLADIYSQGYGAIGRGLRDQRHADRWHPERPRLRHHQRAGQLHGGPGPDAQGHHGGQCGSQQCRRPGRPDRCIEPVGLARCGRQGGGQRVCSWRQASA